MIRKFFCIPVFLFLLMNSTALYAAEPANSPDSQVQAVSGKILKHMEEAAKAGDDAALVRDFSDTMKSAFSPAATTAVRDFLKNCNSLSYTGFLRQAGKIVSLWKMETEEKDDILVRLVLSGYGKG